LQQRARKGLGIVDCGGEKITYSHQVIESCLSGRFEFALQIFRSCKEFDSLALTDAILRCIRGGIDVFNEFGDAHCV
jgi:hypothetical protein